MNRLGTPDYYTGTIKVSDNDGRGWMESYVLKGSDYGQAWNSFVPVINYRAAILANSLFLSDWSVHNSYLLNDAHVGTDSISASPTLLDAETTAEDYNAIEDALKVRLQTTDGKHSTRLIRGIRDSWIDEDVVGSDFAGVCALGVGVTVARADAMAAADAWASFVASLRDNTRLVRQATAPGPVYTNTFYNFTDAYTSPVAVTRQTGRDPFASKGRIKRAFV